MNQNEIENSPFGICGLIPHGQILHYTLRSILARLSNDASGTQTLQPQLLAMKAITSIICSMLLTVTSKAWDPPIGIPEPNWPGIGNPIELVAPTPPANWIADQVGYYYINSLIGTNSGRTYGNPTAPRSTIPSPLPAGSKVFMAGTYKYSHQHPGTILAKGTSERPVWILSVDPLNPCIFTGSLRFKPGTRYAIVDNIHWDWRDSADGGNIGASGGEGGIADTVAYVCFRNGSTINRGTEDGTSTAPRDNRTACGISNAGTDWTTTVEQIVIFNMKFTKGGMWMYASGDPDGSGVVAERRTRDIWVLDCEFSYFSGSAIGSGVGVPTTLDADCTERMYVGRCVAHHVAQGAFWSKRCKDCVWSQNIIHTLRRNTPSFPNACGIGGQYGGINMWILFNEVYNCQGGVSILTGADASIEGVSNGPVYIIGNVLHNIHDETTPIGTWIDNNNQGGGTAILLRASHGVVVLNNTIHDYDAGIISNSYSLNHHVENNIFSGRNGAVPGVDVLMALDPSGLNVFRANIIEEINGKCYWRMGDTTRTTVATINTIGEIKAGNSNVAPTYVNKIACNYALASGSSGIDSIPIANPVYDLFQTMYGRSIAYDRNGRSRPQNAKWDIGAYEYTSPLNAPKNLGVDFPK